MYVILSVASILHHLKLSAHACSIYMQGAHKRKERSAAIYPNVNSAARCARPVDDDTGQAERK